MIAGTMFLVCVVILELFYGRDSADKVSGGQLSVGYNEGTWYRVLRV